MWLPSVAPLHGGVEARRFACVREPKRGRPRQIGPRMLSVDNDAKLPTQSAGPAAPSGLHTLERLSVAHRPHPN